MERAACLIFVQVDHISGEVTGFAVGRIMELGARNVQLIPAITKKNRPGTIIIIDADEEREDRIARFLATELKVSGYHRINTIHVHQNVSFLRKSLLVRQNGRSKSLDFTVKVVGDPAGPLSVDVEHDFLVEAQEVMKDMGRHISLAELRTLVESRLHEPGDEIMVCC